MALSKINVRSPFYLLADPNTTTTTASPPLPTLDCSGTGFILSDGITGETITASDYSITTGTVDSISPATYQGGSDQEYTVDIIVPSGYTNTGDTLECTATATGDTTTTTLAPTTSAGCTTGGITYTPIPDQTVDHASNLQIDLSLYASSSGNLSYSIIVSGDSTLFSTSVLNDVLSIAANSSGNCDTAMVNIVISDDANSCEVTDYFRVTVANCPATTLSPSTTQPEPASISINSLLTQNVGENPSYEIEFSYTTLINNVPTVRTRTHTLPVPASGDYQLNSLVSVISNVTATVSRISPDNTVADSTTIDFYRNGGTYEQRYNFNTTDVVENVSYTFTGVVTDDALYVQITEG